MVGVAMPMRVTVAAMPVVVREIAAGVVVNIMPGVIVMIMVI